MSLLPLFPLPNVVLFPGVPLPLHIFEPRYRAMVADAIDADGLIGMVLLKPGFEGDYDGRPEIYPVGCTGVIVHSTRLDDGRYNIVLQGVERFRVVEENHERPYRRATIDRLPDPPLEADDKIALIELRQSLEATVGETSLPDADLIHTVAHAMDLEPLEKQALLERENLRLRGQSLIELMEMRRLIANLPAMPNRPQ